MPIYIYKHPTKDNYEEVIQRMDDVHSFFKDGLEWGRVFLVPHASISSNADPFNSNSFIEKTGKMKGTVGDMISYSEELSEKRAEKHGGQDPVRQQHFKNYEKDVGKKHISDKPKSLENKSMKIDFD
jgi:hypothetical protein|tara:strand:- start:195 stop:575 length:381 start_codon:yes stop_codon:yes gene_type:complete